MSADAAMMPARLPGWDRDDLAPALLAYGRTAGQLPAGWPQPDDTPAGEFFSVRFVARPLFRPALVTGYYEPELPASPVAGGVFRHPLHALPVIDRDPWLTRAEILGTSLPGVLGWVEDPLDAFLAQVQGSVRLRMPDGALLRLGFAGRNGHPYRSIGAELIAMNEVRAEDMSIPAIRAWCAANPGQVAALLARNPSYVFFRRLDLPDDSGPPGAMGAPLEPGRSIAVDWALCPPGAPVWLEGPGFDRLCVAQDSGSAITGSRVDLFCGSGAGAGATAGTLRAEARAWLLRPAVR